MNNLAECLMNLVINSRLAFLRAVTSLFCMVEGTSGGYVSPAHTLYRAVSFRGFHQGGVRLRN
jgi:hypothetical protein